MGGLPRAGVLVGLISDTHGLVRPEALRALAGVSAIIHAGDVGAADVLETLGRLAPVTAVRGNVDRESWAEALPWQARLKLGRQRILVVHDLATLTEDGRAAGVDIVISGHSHQPRVAERDGVLYINPGSAGPRRFRLPVCVGLLRLGARRRDVRIVELKV